jgi:predicted nucleic acid-binding protein
MKIIFADTNRLFPAFCKRKSDPTSIPYSKIYDIFHTENIDFYVSDYVAGEIDRVYNRDFKKIWTNLSEVNAFFGMLNCHIFLSQWLTDIYLPFVHDKDDAEIVWDAVACKADYLWTWNIKDFKIQEIYTSFNIKVIEYLSQAWIIL